ncbi:MAG: HIT family protein [Candidatus Pacebacteria bacterium]|jgi:histidine triad (HIT) family protein|nr:HIT family protein [Candidatus Paceibacterota bacterium]
MDNCVFCNPKIDRGERIHETENFFVEMGLGVAAPGHVMLIPKFHCDCYADMPVSLRPEFKRMKDLVFGKIKEVFGEPFLVEYGITLQSVPHAHLHFIPKRREATQFYPAYQIENVFSIIGAPDGMGAPASWEAAERFRKEHGGYIFIQDGAARFFAEFPDDFPSQRFGYRNFFGGKLGIADVPVHWQEITENDLAIDKAKKDITKKFLKF